MYIAVLIVSTASYDIIMLRMYIKVTKHKWLHKLNTMIALWASKLDL